MISAPDSLRTVDAGEVILRPFREDDIPVLVEAFADPQIARWNPGSGTTAAEAGAWSADRNDWSDGSHASWAIGDVSGRLLGSVSVFAIDPQQGDAEIGYWLGPWARGGGRAARAVVAATGACFDVLGLHRIHLHHAVENTASCRVAGRAGFTLEGRLRQSYRYADGAYHDEHVHGLLATDPRPR